MTDRKLQFTLITKKFDAWLRAEDKDWDDESNDEAPETFIRRARLISAVVVIVPFILGFLAALVTMRVL